MRDVTQTGGRASITAIAHRLPKSQRGLSKRADQESVIRRAPPITRRRRTMLRMRRSRSVWIVAGAFRGEFGDGYVRFAPICCRGHDGQPPASNSGLVGGQRKRLDLLEDSSLAHGATQIEPRECLDRIYGLRVTPVHTQPLRAVYAGRVEVLVRDMARAGVNALRICGDGTNK